RSVISLKRIRWVFFLSIPSSWARCQPMASPSRSGSVAMYSDVTFSAAFLRSSRTFFLAGSTLYSGLNPFFSFTPRLDLGRSRTCPIEALTMKPASRYFWIVLTLVGDSTTTSERDLANGLLSAMGGPDESLPGQLAYPPLELEGEETRGRAGGGEAAPHDQFFHGHRLLADQGEERIRLLEGCRRGGRRGPQRRHARPPARPP